MNIAYERALILHEAGSYADAEWQLASPWKSSRGLSMHGQCWRCVWCSRENSPRLVKPPSERLPTIRHAIRVLRASPIAAQAIPIGQAVGHGSTVMWAFFAIEIAMTFFFVALPAMFNEE